MKRPSVPSAAATAVLALGSRAGADVLVDTTFNDADWALSISTSFNPGSVSEASQAVGAGFGSGLYSLNILTAQGWDGGFDLGR